MAALRFQCRAETHLIHILEHTVDTHTHTHRVTQFIHADTEKEPMHSVSPSVSWEKVIAAEVKLLSTSRLFG